MFTSTVALQIFLHKGIRGWCCGELERAGTGRCRSVEAAVEPTLEAGTSRWWPAPGHSEPAGRSLPGRLAAAPPGPAWPTPTASYPIVLTPGSPRNKRTKKKKGSPRYLWLISLNFFPPKFSNVYAPIHSSVHPSTCTPPVRLCSLLLRSHTTTISTHTHTHTHAHTHTRC